MTIIFLHTAQTHIDTFQPILDELDDKIPREHIVIESLLEEARAGKNPERVQSQIATLIQHKLQNDDDVMLCTCSTIGPIAEALNRQRVLRVDRPMMDEAVKIGGKIRILATLESTRQPTMTLFKEVAGDRQMDVEFIVISEAWPYFERGDLEGYYRTIGQKLEAVAQTADVIILAQASMLGALELTSVVCPVLSSPRLGVKAIVNRANKLGEC